MMLNDYLKSGNYLPEFLRDFHNQKDLFKRIDETVANSQEKNKDDIIYKRMPGWTICHIYVVDYFLWHMAKCGYTLQRSRAKIEFIDYDEDMAAALKRRMHSLRIVV